MPTSQPRLNLTLDAEIMKMLKALAKKTKKSVGTLAKELLLDALETQEDIYFSKLADKRDTKDAKWISHEEFWNS